MLFRSGSAIVAKTLGEGKKKQANEYFSMLVYLTLIGGIDGTEQFFMDDTSRNGEAHYGMGLFFAKTVAEKYGGGIRLSNSENTGGARVEIFFLSSQETS